MKNITKKLYVKYINVYKDKTNELLYSILFSPLDLKLIKTQCKVFGGRWDIVVNLDEVCAELHDFKGFDFNKFGDFDDGSGPYNFIGLEGFIKNEK